MEMCDELYDSYRHMFEDIEDASYANITIAKIKDEYSHMSTSVLDTYCNKIALSDFVTKYCEEESLLTL